MTLVMPGVAHGHNEVMMMYVGLENGCRFIWGKLCVICLEDCSIPGLFVGRFQSHQDASVGSEHKTCT